MLRAECRVLEVRYLVRIGYERETFKARQGKVERGCGAVLCCVVVMVGLFCLGVVVLKVWE